jgi:23S rRNA (cytosine1962-C5)-methyltransferase
MVVAMLEMRLKPGREKSLLRRHPWVFSGAVAHVHGEHAAGETARLLSHAGEFLGWGAYSPISQIQARIWNWDADELIDEDFFRRRLRKILSQRKLLFQSECTDALRLVYGESDGLPGLIVDSYAGVLVAQFLSCGPEAWRIQLAQMLLELTGADSVYERSDADVRKLEGLPMRCGQLLGSDPPAVQEIQESGLIYGVDVRAGHKTGFYLDQRTNRRRVRSLAAGREVLDCFCYTGGFTLSALAGGASKVMAVDSSPDALAQAQKNLLLNHLDGSRVEWLQEDVFKALRALRDRGRMFDMIILDPPKFAPTAAKAQNAARGYKDINLLAFKLLRPGGLLVTYSCSGGVGEDLFQKIVAGAALDANVDGCILERLYQGPDHPVALSFPEGLYLKGLVVQVA